jgi:hypothetical protein
MGAGLTYIYTPFCSSISSLKGRNGVYAGYADSTFCLFSRLENSFPKDFGRFFVCNANSFIRLVIVAVTITAS